MNSSCPSPALAAHGLSPKECQGGAPGWDKGHNYTQPKEQAATTLRLEKVESTPG